MILVFGKKYEQVLVNNLDFSYGVSILQDKLIINQFHTRSQPDLLIERFLKNTAQKYIIPRTQILAQKMAIKYARVSLKQQKTRWGSCSSRGNLNFNWRLVHQLPAVIDYVIIHELAHRQEMNHSAKFWALVRKFDLSYKLHRGVLKRTKM